MGKRFPTISSRLQTFIEAQKIFFVGTAGGADTRVNVSPKGMDSLRVLAPDRVVWLNVTGSGNETAAHILENDRMTIMFCAFEGAPMILRLYGQAKIYHPDSPEWTTLAPLFPPLPGARQIFDVSIYEVQTSCGMAVPLYSFEEDRDALNKWAVNKGEEGIQQYWKDRNEVSLDGKRTDIEQ
ncbi:MAG: pyridoxamine 5'-phosphate oxidase family protein [Bacteroidota bacterium]